MSDRWTQVTIERLGAQGDGVASGPDGPRYIHFALPGEIWRVPVDPGPSAPPVMVTPDASRRGALCPHFGRCGGCQTQHMPDALYAAWKIQTLTDAFAHRGLDVAPEPIVRVPLASRRRAVFAAETRPDGVMVGFHEALSHRLEPVTACAVLRPAIVSALPVLRDLVGALIAPGARLKDPVRLTVLETAGGLAVDIAGVGKADAGSLGPVARARVAAIAAAHGLAVVSIAGDPIVRRAPAVIALAGVTVEPPPGSFIQAVPEAEAAMTAIVLEAVGKARRVADLFAGLGTFALALARRARVLAVDGEAGLLAALMEATRRAQGLKPVDTLVRDLMREPLSAKELESFEAIVFDPPRAGAAAQVERIARTRCPAVVAVSCNPATLARDVRVLIDAGWRLERLVPIDQFVMTPHLEAVAVLRR